METGRIAKKNSEVNETFPENPSSSADADLAAKEKKPVGRNRK